MTALERLRAALEAATPGPWRDDRVSDTSRWVRADPGPKANVPIAHLGANHPESTQRANTVASAALGTLHPALLTVVDEARGQRPMRESSPACGTCPPCDMLRRLDALDAAIAAALPEAP